MKKRNYSKKTVGKVVTGLVIGSVVGATVGWLTAPASGQEMRRRLAGDIKGAREKIRTAEGNVESRIREFASEVNETADDVTRTANRRAKVASTS